MTKRPQKPDIIYAGTYSVRGSKGIYVLQFDKGKLRIVQTLDYGDSPTFLAVSPDKEVLYAVYKTGAEDGLGMVRSFLINELTGHLTFLDERSSEGVEPAHISVDPQGRQAYVSNYESGSLVIYPINKSGSLGPPMDLIQHTGGGIISDRQEGPHIHSAIPSDDGRFIYVSDLGNDKINVYSFSKGDGLYPHPAFTIPIPAGSGPRHLTIHPALDYAYSVQELSSTITGFKVDKQNGPLTELGRYTTLPSDFEGFNLAADIHISKDGRYLYASNRGHDSIAIYRIDEQLGTLQQAGHVKTLGKEPRNFMIHHQDEYLIAGHQESDHIVVFRRDKATGALSPSGEEFHVPAAVCLVQLS